MKHGHKLLIAGLVVVALVVALVLIAPGGGIRWHRERSSMSMPARAV